MVRRLFQQLLLRPEDLQPSHDDWEIVGAFNPGAARVGDQVVLLVRVAQRPSERRAGLIALPRWSKDGPTMDWEPVDDYEPLDARVVRRKADGTVRLTSVSHLQLVRSGDGRAIDSAGQPVLVPQSEWEEYGVEDPRITQIGQRYYVTYVAVSRHGAATALASTTDFRQFTRHGIIFPPENKDVVLFAEPVGDHYLALHRPNGATPFTAPEMWLARSPDLVAWGQHEPLFSGLGDWQSGRVGAGAPPLLVPAGRHASGAAGWLEIYHANRRPTRAGDVGCYTAGAMLLAADNPARIVRRSTEPILQPETDYECRGFVPYVVFPTAVIENDETLLVYYGASDTCTAVVELSRAEVLACMNTV